MENEATEATKLAWRTLREAVCTVVAAQEGSETAQSNEAAAASVIEAVVPILLVLTGRDRASVLEACLRRLIKDGRVHVDTRTTLRLVG